MAFSAPVATAIGLAGLGASAYQGIESARLQKKSLIAQREMRARAETEALSQQRKAQDEIRKKTIKEPDVAAILASEGLAGLTGFQSTLLSGGRSRLGV